MVIVSNSVAETEVLGERLGKVVRPNMIIAMSGDLGAGKTAFVRGLAKGMGLKARVTSPTFSIVNEYLGALPLYHFDMYRLTSEEDLFDIGWEDYIRKGGVCVVEWSERVSGAIDDNAIRLDIRRIDDNTRQIEICGIDF